MATEGTEARPRDDEDDGLHRLRDMVVEEVSLVDRAAKTMSMKIHRPHMRYTTFRRSLPVVVMMGLLLVLLQGCSQGAGDQEGTSSTPPAHNPGPSPSPSPAPSPGSAVLEWDPNIEPDLAGYRVYYGTTPGSYLQAKGHGIVVAGTSYTLTGLQSGTRYYFSVTAFDGAGNESDYSREVFKDVL